MDARWTRQMDERHSGERPDDGAREAPATWTDVHALYRQGQSRLADGHARAAAEVLELAVQHEPRKASLHETLGRAYFASARVDRAREAFAHALEIDPSDAYAHFGIGRCYERQGNLPDAAKHLKLACVMAPRHAYHDALERVLQRLSA